MSDAEAAPMDAPTMLAQAREKFREGLWQSSGWGGENGLQADRRCVVGTLRWITKTHTSQGIAHRDAPERSPWFFSYEEGVFEIVSILFENDYLRGHYGWNERVIKDGFDPVVEVREMQKEYGHAEHAAILVVLDSAEGALISYNDGCHSSAGSMIELMDKAIERINEKRAAIAAEHAVKEQIDMAAASGVDPEQLVVASRADETAAREEFEAEHGKTWDPWTHDAEGNELPPIWSYQLNANKGGKGKRKGKFAKQASSLKSRFGGKITNEKRRQQF